MDLTDFKIFIGELKMMAKKMEYSKLRLFIQLVFVGVILTISIMHATGAGGENLHGICPFGGVATMYTFVTTGDYIRHLGQSDFIMLFSLMITLVLAGAFFCGWICPLGSVQEWVGKLGKKIFGKRYNRVPKRLDRILSYAKYGILVLILFQTGRSFTLLFKNFDPYYNLFNIWTDEISILGYLSVIIVLMASLFIERPFCRYACPLGAINGLFNSFSILNIRRNEESCIDCKACDKACPVGLEPSVKGRISSTACIRCMKCVESCPVNAKTPTLIVSTRTKKHFSLRSWLFAGILLLAFFIPIIISISTGQFDSEEPRVYETANDIRGSYELGSIVENYGIDKAVFYRAFNLKDDLPLSTKVKDLESTAGVSTEGLREVVGNFRNDLSLILPEATQGTSYRDMTVEAYILKNEPGAILELMEKEGVSVNEEKENEEVVIKRTTMLVEIKEIVDDYDAFLTHFGISAGNPLNTEMRTLIDEYGININDVREYVNIHVK
jgi:polyferredoxin